MSVTQSSRPDLPDLPDLPVLACLDELYGALQAGHVILSAATGSGKTTLVPLALLDQPWLQGKKIIMLEPRRPAARMAARRMASLCGEKVGATVGYQVRFERRVSAQTRIEVLTEGLLLRRLQADPEMGDVGLVIFDEFHERSLAADLSLALCLDVCNALRDDLRLLVMSASLQGDRLAALLPAQTVSAEGRLYPVEVQYATQTPRLADVVDACVPLVAQALSSVDGDVLVFLPGRAEIERLQAIAVERWGRDCEVLTLSGEQDAQHQDRVLNPQQRDGRRLVLATDIAETSLTIEGIDAVVDSGRVRKPVFQANSGLTRLELQWISRASALQRAGRAGRLGPGRCLRAWSETHQQSLAASAGAEILQADLASTVLELASWGVTSPHSLAWLDPPPEAHWQQAVELLQRLQAVDAHGQITPAGRQMSVLPLHPRLAHMLLSADDSGQVDLAADLAALLSERDPFTRRPGESLPLDLSLRLAAWQDWRQGRSPSAVDRRRLQRLERAAQQYRKLLQHTDANSSSGSNIKAHGSIGALLALAYPDRVAMRRGRGDGYLMSNGRGVSVPADDSLAGEDFLVIADLDAGRREGRAWLAASLALDEIETLYATQIRQQRSSSWDDDAGKVVARQQSCLGALVLREQVVALQAGDDVTAILLAQVRRQGLALFGQQQAFERLRARIATLRRVEADDEQQSNWPDITEAALLQQLEHWLLPWLDGLSSLRQLRQLNLADALQQWLGWERQQVLQAQLPESYTTPAGTQRPIGYDLQEAPSLRVPLQEMLGESVSPKVAGGRLQLVVHLLSPAGRPLQVTADLAAFWQGAYQEVKKEMRGRYPKHVWPDDPAAAQATRFTRKKAAAAHRS